MMLKKYQELYDKIKKVEENELITFEQAIYSALEITRLKEDVKRLTRATLKITQILAELNKKSQTKTTKKKGK